MAKKEVKDPIVEEFEEGTDGDFEFTRADLDAAIETAIAVTIEKAIAFAEQLAPGRNGGKRMREFFDGLAAKAKG